MEKIVGVGWGVSGWVGIWKWGWGMLDGGDGGDGVEVVWMGVRNVRGGGHENGLSTSNRRLFFLQGLAGQPGLVGRDGRPVSLCQID